jgi:hypothetical protein
MRVAISETALRIYAPRAVTAASEIIGNSWQRCVPWATSKYLTGVWRSSSHPVHTL